MRHLLTYIPCLDGKLFILNKQIEELVALEKSQGNLALQVAIKNQGDIGIEVRANLENRNIFHLPVYIDIDENDNVIRISIECFGAMEKETIQDIAYAYSYPLPDDEYEILNEEYEDDE